MAGVPAQARTVSVGVDRLERWIAGFGQRHGDCAYRASDSRVCLSAADGSRAWIEVPFAPLTDYQDDPVAALIGHAHRSRRIGVLLVRRGGYAAGIFQGDALVSSKVGSSYVQGTTKAGGWSQQRYARRRDNQASAAFAEAADQAVRILLPEAAGLAGVFCGGDRKAIAAVLADKRLEPIAALVLDDFFAVPDPRLRVLAAMPAQFLAVTIRLDP